MKQILMMLMLLCTPLMAQFTGTFYDSQGVEQNRLTGDATYDAHMDLPANFDSAISASVVFMTFDGNGDIVSRTILQSWTTPSPNNDSQVVGFNIPAFTMPPDGYATVTVTWVYYETGTPVTVATTSSTRSVL